MERKVKMKEYHKIQTVFKRDPDNRYKTLLDGEFSTPEFAYLANNEWSFTEKVDGTNIRIMFDGENITFGGKTDRAQIPALLLNKLTEMFFNKKAKEMFKSEFHEGVCLYGEGYGARIQKGEMYRQDQSFVLFDVKIGDWWLSQDDISDVAYMFSIDTVPLMTYGTLYDMIKLVKGGFYSEWGDFKAEGIVARPTIELKTRSGSRIITKIKHKDFKKA